MTAVVHVASLRVLSPTAILVGSHLWEEHPVEWRALLDWCERHGMAPRDMPAAQLIVRNMEARRVEYDQIVRDDQGRVTFDPVTLVYVRQRVRAQGETPPMPFPDVILDHLDSTPEHT